jgi:hypothetical protein
MALPNQNTNNNLVCPDGSTFQGFIFDGTNGDPTMSIVKGADTLIEFSLKDVFMPVGQYVVSDFLVKANGTIFIDGDAIQNSLGEVQFFTLLVTYPEQDVNKIIVATEEKYINFQYPAMGASTYNLGKIMMLTGTTKAGSGWGLNESPGGITLINPHSTFDVRVKMLAFN